MTGDRELAALCADAYLPDPTVAIGDDLAASITLREDVAIIAFRGTANPRGWIRDIDALPKSHPMIGYCHRGFLTGASALMQKVSLPADRRIVITGHSLGGALAVIFGALRIAVGQRVDQLVTFGAPRAGYSKLVSMWAGFADARQYRCGNDPVTDVPLQLLAFPYEHVKPLTLVGMPVPQEPWTCHDIRRYQQIVAD